MTVVRNGRTEEISTAELLVGDVMLMDTGDILPADGILFQGNDIRQVSLPYPWPVLICVHPVQHGNSKCAD